MFNLLLGMNKRRRIFFLIFGVYHLLLLIFISYIEIQKNDLSLLYGLYTKISLMRNGAILGLLLFAIDFAWNWFEKRSAKKHQDIIRHENDILKAKIYDMQQTAKGDQPAMPPSKDKSQ